MKTVTIQEIAFRLREYCNVLHERFLEKPDKINVKKLLKSAQRFLPECPFETFSEEKHVCRLWKEHFPDSVEETVSLADAVCRNQFPIFSGTMKYDQEVDWHREYTTGRASPLKFYRDIDTIGSEYIDDVKILWEINRHNFMLFLGKAYMATGNRTYYEKWRELVVSWVDNNPYNMGINWESSLELAVRSINWIWASFFFKKELQRDRELQAKVFITLYLHGLHIRRHLSCYFSPNTHLTGEALGLLYLGKCFPQMKSSFGWTESAIKILESELFRQVFEDGGYFEMATYYHKYTIDFYIHYLLLNRNALISKPEIGSRIRRLIKHLVLLSEPDGTIPLLGDSDGGQLLFFNMEKNNIKGACCAGAVIFDDSELKHMCGSNFQEEAFWLLGPAGMHKFNAMESLQAKTCHSVNRDTGLFCFRTGMSDQDACLTVDCGDHGWGTCGHAHSDLLSFEWYSNGVKVIVDPGTYKYSGSNSLRNGYRSSQYHNTVTIDDVSQSIPSEAFKWRKIAHPKYSYAAFLGDFGYFEGEHDAYEHLGCNHKRIIGFFGNNVSIIIDAIKAEKPFSSLLCNFQFNEGHVTEIGNHIYQFHRRGVDNYIRFLSTIDFNVDILDGDIFPDYNYKLTAPKMRLIEKNVVRDHMVVSLLSSERQLIESFNFDGKGKLTSDYSSSEYNISIGDLDNNKAAHDLPCSIFYNDGSQVLIILRNGSVARNSTEDVRFKSNQKQDLFIATLKDGVLCLKTKQIPSSFSMPYEIREIFVGDNAISFQKTNDIIKLGSPL